MAFLTDDRAQALQVGAVLLFGILVILFTVWQAFVIPDANERVEFTHNQEVQSEMVSLQGTAISTADSGTPQSTSVQLGQQFPSRLLFVNPSPATGTLRTTAIGDGGVQITNANATGLTDEAFWNGTERNYTTRAVEYTPDYRVFQGAPRTVYDNTLLYNAFDRADETNVSAIASQSILSGDTISLVMLAGSYEETGIASVNPSFTPVSTQTETVRVNSSEDDPLTLTIASEVDAETWEETLSDEENFAEATQIDNTIVAIELEGGTYDLRLSKVGLGTGVDTPLPAYLTTTDGFEESVSPGETRSVSVEVRDRFNAPVSDVAVNASVDSGGVFVGEENGEVEVISDELGQATFDFEVGPGVPDGENITLEFGLAEEADALAEDAVDEFEANLTVERDAAQDSQFEVEWVDYSPEGFIECEESDGTLESCDVDYVSGEPESPSFTVEATGPEDTAPQGHVQFAIIDSENAEIEPTNTTIEPDDGDFGDDERSEATVEIVFEDGAKTELVVFGGGDVAVLPIQFNN